MRHQMTALRCGVFLPAALLSPSFSRALRRSVSSHTTRFSSLYANALGGTLPPALGNISTLVSLDLSETEINGEIPSAIGGLSSLVLLDLSGCFLEGSLPASFGQLTRLQYLCVTYLD